MIEVTDELGRTATAETTMGAARVLWHSAVTIKGRHVYDGPRRGSNALGYLVRIQGFEENPKPIWDNLQLISAHVHRAEVMGLGRESLLALRKKRSAWIREALRFGLRQVDIAEHANLTATAVAAIKRRAIASGAITTWKDFDNGVHRLAG